MAKWLLAVGGVALIVLLYFVVSALREPAKKPKVAKPAASGTKVAEPPADAWPAPIRKAKKGPPSDAGTGEDTPKMVDPKSEAFSDRIDIVISDKFRAHVSDCYKGGDDPDKTLKIRYRLRIVNGIVHAADVRPHQSELDKKLEECMLNAVRQASWEAKDMPDHEEEQELFIRLRALKKYKTRPRAR